RTRTRSPQCGDSSTSTSTAGAEYEYERIELFVLVLLLLLLLLLVLAPPVRRFEHEHDWRYKSRRPLGELPKDGRDLRGLAVDRTPRQHPLAARLAQTPSLPRRQDHRLQSGRQRGDISRCKQSPAAGRGHQFGKRAMSGLDHRHSRGERLQHEQSLG